MVTAKQIPDLITVTRFWLMRRIVRAGAGSLFALSFLSFFSIVYGSLFEQGTEATYTGWLAFSLIVVVLIGSIWALLSLRPLAVLVTGLLGIVVSLSIILVILVLAISARPEAIRTVDPGDPSILFFELSVIFELMLFLWQIILFRIVPKPSWIVRFLIDGLIILLILFQSFIALDAIYWDSKEANYLVPLFFLFIPLGFLYVYSSLFAKYQSFSNTLRGLEPDKTLLKWVGNIVSEIKEANVRCSDDIIELRFKTKPKRCRIILCEEIAVLLPILPTDFFEVPMFIAKPEFRLHVRSTTAGQRKHTVAIRLQNEDVTAQISDEHLRRYREWAVI